MKKFLLVIVISFCLCTVHAQLHNTLPLQATEFYNKAMGSIKPEISAYITSVAKQIGERDIDPNSLYSQMKKSKQFEKLDEAACKPIVLLILVRCSMNADALLKQKVLQMQRNNDNDKNYEATEALVARKSNLAADIRLLLAEINDENIALKNFK